MQEGSVDPVLLESIACVAFGQVGVDQDALGAFSERLSCHGGNPRLYGLAETAQAHESLTQQLQRVEAKVPKRSALPAPSPRTSRGGGPLNCRR